MYEFVEARMKLMELYFNKFDTDKSGYIEKKEFAGLAKFFLMMMDPHSSVPDD